MGREEHWNKIQSSTPKLNRGHRRLKEKPGIIQAAAHFIWKDFYYSNVIRKEAASELLVNNPSSNPVYAEDPFNSTRSFHLVRTQVWLFNPGKPCRQPHRADCSIAGQGSKNQPLLRSHLWVQ